MILGGFTFDMPRDNCSARRAGKMKRWHNVSEKACDPQVSFWDGAKGPRPLLPHDHNNDQRGYLLQLKFTESTSLRLFWGPPDLVKVRIKKKKVGGGGVGFLAVCASLY